MFFYPLLCAYAFAPTALPQADRPITFTSHAAPLYRLLPELSKAAGLKLETSQQMSDTVMVVKVDKVPLKDLMKRLAEASTGEWKKTDEGYQLGLSLADARSEEIDEAKSYVASIDKAINEQVAMWRKADYKGSANGFIRLAQVLRLYGLSNIAILPSGQTFVYSNKPNPLQYPMPPMIQLAIERFLKEDSSNGSEAGPPEATTLMLRIPKFSNSLQACISVTDQKGQSIMYASDCYIPAPRERIVPEIAEPTEPFELDTSKKKEILALAASAGFKGTSVSCRMPYQGSSDSEFQSRTVSEETMTKVLEPEINEPLALPGEALEWLAGARNLIAVVPDGAFAPAYRFLATWDGAPKKLVSSMVNDWGIKIKQPSNWLVVNPQNPVWARTYRLHRRELGLALRQAAKQGMMSLSQEITFAYSQPEAPIDGNFEFAYLRLINPHLGLFWAGCNYTFYGDTLRFLGTLTADQRKQTEDQGLPLSNLLPNQLKIVRRLAMASNFDNTVTEIDETRAETARRSRLNYNQFEPTWMIGPEWGDSLRIRIVRYQEPLSVYGIGARGMIDPIGMPQGWSITGGGPGQPPLVAGGTRTYSKYYLGKRVRWQLGIGSSDNSYCFVLFDDTVDAGGRVLSHDELPTKYLDLLDRKTKELEKALKDFGGAQVRP